MYPELFIHTVQLVSTGGEQAFLLCLPSHTHLLQSAPEPEIRGWIQSLWAKGGLTLHHSPVTVTSSFQQPYFKKKLTRQMLSSPREPRPSPFGTWDREAPCLAAQSQAEICSSYSVLSTLRHSRLLHRHGKL